MSGRPRAARTSESRKLMGMRVPVVAAGIAASFCALTGVVILMALYAVVTPQRALLMLIALAGLYIGFGILILVRRLIDRLD